MISASPSLTVIYWSFPPYSLSGIISASSVVVALIFLFRVTRATTFFIFAISVTGPDSFTVFAESTGVSAISPFVTYDAPS